MVQTTLSSGQKAGLTCGYGVVPGGAYLLWHAVTPLWAEITLWLGIITVSLIWRIILCCTFSLASVRRTYSRIHRVVGKAAGVLLCALATRLIYQGTAELLSRR